MEVNPGEIWGEKTRIFDFWQILSFSEEKVQVRGVYPNNVGLETSVPRDFFEAEFYKFPEDQFVKFWGSKSSHGAFSNFSSHPILVDGKLWKTNEHYYQAQKFAGTPLEEDIRKLKSPSQVYYEARSPIHKLRSDWEEVKEEVMYKGLKAKFTQHAGLKRLLLETGDKHIVEDSPKDYYWGWGKTRTGRNRLGYLLMKLREELRAEKTE